MAENTWTADRRLYLDKDGKVVEADDPTRARLLIAQGGALPIEQAKALGLVVEEKAAAAPAAQKLSAGPSANKAAATAAPSAPTLGEAAASPPADEKSPSEGPVPRGKKG